MVNSNAYGAASSRLASIYSLGGKISSLKYSSNSLYAFSHNQGLGNGAVNTLYSNFSINDKRLDHHVGASYSGGLATIDQATFDWSNPATTAPYDVANSNAMRMMIDGVLKQHTAELVQAGKNFSRADDGETAQLGGTSDWSLDNAISFEDLSDPDLHF